MKRPIVLLTDDEMHGLTDRVAKEISKLRAEAVPVVPLTIRRFANKEMCPQIPQTLRSLDVFLFFGFSPNPNVRLVELFLTIDALQRASVERIILVLPFIPYLRQDRKDQPRVPISARAVANLIESHPRVRQIITLDMHCEQEQGFFNIPVDNLKGSKTHAEFLRQTMREELKRSIIISPDFGGAERVRLLARELGDLPVGVLQKRRIGTNMAETLSYIGKSPKAKHVIIYDDMLDTGGSAVGARKFLMKKGAKSVTLCVTHGLFSAKSGKPAERQFSGKSLRVVTTESIQRKEPYLKKHASWLTVLPISRMLAQAIDQSSTPGGSVSQFDTP